MTKHKTHTIMGIFAHPDDESFGPGATLAKYSSLGHRIIVLTATRGQAGQASGKKIKHNLGVTREEETIKAGKILGVSKNIFLDFFDGSLSEQLLPVLKKSIETKIKTYQPDVIIIYEPSGISLHLDHVAVTKSVLELFDGKKIKPKKIYFFGYSRQLMLYIKKKEGGLVGKHLTKIDVKAELGQKIKAMKAHESQKLGWQRLIKLFQTVKTLKIGRKQWQYEYFQLARTSLKKIKQPENDLLAGLC